jgi:hypothetical protein
VLPKPSATVSLLTALGGSVLERPAALATAAAIADGIKLVTPVAPEAAGMRLEGQLEPAAKLPAA